MARRSISLEEQIEKAQVEVAQTKQKYDQAVDKLEALLNKKKERDSKELIEAFTASEKTLADVLAFLKGNVETED